MRLDRCSVVARALMTWVYRTFLFVFAACLYQSFGPWTGALAVATSRASAVFIAQYVRHAAR